MVFLSRSLPLGLVLLLVPVTPTRARDLHRVHNELSLGFGGAFGQASPDSGGLVELHYARALSDSWWLVLRPEFVMNLNAPGGTVAKQAAFGLDIGVRWHLGPRDTIHFALGVALGARGYFEPGYGACLRVDGHLYVPVNQVLDFIISAALEGGPALLGDGFSRTEWQDRKDLWMGVAFRF